MFEKQTDSEEMSDTIWFIQEDNVRKPSSTNPLQNSTTANTLRVIVSQHFIDVHHLFQISNVCFVILPFLSVPFAEWQKR